MVERALNVVLQLLGERSFQRSINNVNRAVGQLPDVSRQFFTPNQLQFLDAATGGLVNFNRGTLQTRNALGQLQPALALTGTELGLLALAEVEVERSARGLPSAMGEVDKSVKKTTDSVKKAGQASQQMRINFALNFLSVLFFGQALQRFFVGFARTTIQVFNEIATSQNDTRVSLQALAIEFEALKFAVGNAIATALEPYIPLIINIIERMINWIDENQNLVASLIGGGAVLGALLAVTGTTLLFLVSLINIGQTLGGVVIGNLAKFATSMKAGAVATALASLAQALFVIGILAVAAAAIIVVAAFAKWPNALGPAREEIAKLGIVEGLKNQLFALFGVANDGSSDAFPRLAGAALALLVRVIALTQSFLGVINVGAGLVKLIFNIGTSIFRTGEVIGTVLAFVVKGFFGLGKAIGDALFDKIDKAILRFKQLAAAATFDFDRVGELQKQINAINDENVDNFVDGIKQGISDAGAAFTELADGYSRDAEDIAAAFNKIGAGVGGIAEGIKDASAVDTARFQQIFIDAKNAAEAAKKATDEATVSQQQFVSGVGGPGVLNEAAFGDVSLPFQDVQVEPLNNLTESIGLGKLQLTGFQEVLGGVTTQLQEEVGPQILDLSMSIGGEESLLTNLNSVTDKLQAEEGLTTSLSAASMEMGTMKTVVEDLQPAYDDTKGKIEETTKAIDDQKFAAEKLAEVLRRILLLQGRIARSSSDGFKDTNPTNPGTSA